jgi:hypothetical protein
MHFVRLAALAAIALAGLAAAAPAQALTITECSVKYKAAQDAGTLNGMKWSDFRTAQCGAEAAAITPVAASNPANAMPATPAKAPEATAKAPHRLA